MTTATLTAEAAAGDLRADLSALLQRYDGAATLDEFRALADEITTTLRRARGRISRLGRQAKPDTPAEPTPAPAAAPEPAQQTSEHATPQAAPPAAEGQSDHTAPTPVERHPVLPAPRRVSRLGYLLAVLGALWSTLVACTARIGRRVVRRPNHGGAASPAFMLPRPDEAPPLSAMRRSPLDIAAGLQARKRRMYSNYQETVLQWELGERAYQGLTAAVEREEDEVVCIVCGPDCCRPITGDHAECAGPASVR